MPPLTGGVSEEAYYPQLQAQYPGAHGQQLTAAAQDLILRGIAPTINALTGGVSRDSLPPGVLIPGNTATATGGNAKSDSTATATANLYEAPKTDSGVQAAPMNPLQFPNITYPQASPSPYSPLNPIPTSAPTFNGGFGGSGTASTTPQAPTFGGGGGGQPIGSPLGSPQQQQGNGFSVSGGEPGQPFNPAAGQPPMLQGGATYNEPPPGGGMPPMPPNASPWGDQFGQLAQGAYDAAQPFIQGAGDMLSNLGETLGNAFTPAAYAKGQNIGQPPPPPKFVPPPPAGAAMMPGVAMSAANYATQTGPASEAAFNDMAAKMAAQLDTSVKSINQLRQQIKQGGAALAEVLDNYHDEMLAPFDTPIPITSMGPDGRLVQRQQTVMQYRKDLETQVSTYNTAAAHSILNTNITADADANWLHQKNIADRVLAANPASGNPAHRAIAETYADPANTWDEAKRSALQAEAVKAQQYGAEADRLAKHIEQIDASKARVDKQVADTVASASKTYLDGLQFKLDTAFKAGSLAAGSVGLKVAQTRADAQFEQMNLSHKTEQAKLELAMAQIDKETTQAIAKLNAEIDKAQTQAETEKAKVGLEKARTEITRFMGVMTTINNLMKNPMNPMSYDQAYAKATEMAKATQINTKAKP